MYNIYNDERLDSKPLPERSSLVNFSMFKQLDCKINFRSFSIKYVISGCENYEVNGSLYPVKTGNYLLANDHAEGNAKIDSKEIVKGLCIDISPDIIAAAVSSFLRPDSTEENYHYKSFLLGNNYYEKIYNSYDTHLGKLLNNLSHKIIKDPFGDHKFTTEFFIELAEGLVVDHVSLHKEFQSVPAIKSGTKKELLKRCEKAKEQLEADYLLDLDLSRVAKNVNLSEFHFYRLFKSVYKISPYQFVLEKRLAFAQNLLKNKEIKISEVATLSAFSDIFSFSKAYKKRFGFSPKNELKHSKSIIL